MTTPWSATPHRLSVQTRMHVTMELRRRPVCNVVHKGECWYACHAGYENCCAKVEAGEEDYGLSGGVCVYGLFVVLTR